ncbi:hypothetical protein [Microseira sp. BLCC-F43]|uniref:hypothetical protein n=1 Tax=Microseira sp. BLCC-F43 TaxID=3153602 RepID=UPI0035B844AA
MRNQPVFHEEVKQPHRIMLTPTAWKKLQKVAKNRNTSVSEVIEIMSRELDGE